MIGAVFTVVGINVVLFRESEETETSLVKTGSVAVEYVVGFKNSVMEDDIGTVMVDSTNNNNNNCLKSNIQCIEIRVQWTVHLGSSHMHVHAVTRVHAVTPKLVICVMYLTSI